MTTPRTTAAKLRPCCASPGPCVCSPRPSWCPACAARPVMPAVPPVWPWCPMPPPCPRARSSRPGPRRTNGPARPAVTAKAEPCCWPCPPSPAAAAARDVSRAPKNRAGTSVTGRRTDTGTSASAGAPTNATLPTAPSATAATATTASPAVTTGAGPRNDRPILRTGVPDGMKTAAVLTGTTIPVLSPGTTADPMVAALISALTGAPATGVTAMPPGEAVAAGRTSPPSCEGPATGKRVFIHMSAGLPHGRYV